MSRNLSTAANQDAEKMAVCVSLSLYAALAGARGPSHRYEYPSRMPSRVACLFVLPWSARENSISKKKCFFPSDIVPRVEHARTCVKDTPGRVLSTSHVCR